MYNNIITQIINILNTLTEIKAVYNGMPEEITAYPCAVVTPDSEADTYLDTRDMRRDAVIRIRVMGQLDNATYVTSQNVVRTICTDIVETLWKTANLTLNGVISFPTQITTHFEPLMVSNEFYTAVITYKCTLRFTRT